ncbi:metal-dependent hydrolase [Natrialbaceae archaeon GCM10025810]|uniref:metal-dependent hydrolase n=1 Tax=Halovalidus salilacus TaxID=3075124 RepID=UPI003611A312
MEPERALFLTVAFATHAAVGYALVRGFTDADPRLGAVVGVAPDADFLFPAAWGWPFVHRGITHAPLVAALVVLGVAAVRRNGTRSIASAIGLALGSHLAIDSLSPKGIPLAFPLEATWSPGLSVHGPTATVLLLSFAGAVLVWRTDGPIT